MHGSTRNQVAKLQTGCPLIGSRDRGSRILDPILQNITGNIEQDVVHHQRDNAHIRMEQLVRQGRDQRARHTGERADHENDNQEKPCRNLVRKRNRHTGGKASAQVHSTLTDQVELVDRVYKAHTHAREHDRDHRRQNIAESAEGGERSGDELADHIERII